MAALGRAALLLSFGLVVYALVAGSLAACKRRRRLALSAQNALIAAFATTAVAAVVLWIALARRDFSFVYVAEHTSRALHVYEDEDGTVVLRGRLTPEVGALLVQALAAARKTLYQPTNASTLRPA